MSSIGLLGGAPWLISLAVVATVAAPTLASAAASSSPTMTERSAILATGRGVAPCRPSLSKNAPSPVRAAVPATSMPAPSPSARTGEPRLRPGAPAKGVRRVPARLAASLPSARSALPLLPRRISTGATTCVRMPSRLASLAKAARRPLRRPLLPLPPLVALG